MHEPYVVTCFVYCRGREILVYKITLLSVIRNFVVHHFSRLQSGLLLSLVKNRSPPVHMVRQVIRCRRTTTFVQDEGVGTPESTYSSSRRHTAHVCVDASHVSCRGGRGGDFKLKYLCTSKTQ